jgi:hypothetical protein
MDRCNCEAELRGLRLECSMLRHPFIMNGVGFNKYEGRVFLETRTSMLIYIESI